MQELKIGDRVRIIESEDTVNEANGGLGMVGTIISWYTERKEWAQVEIDQFVDGSWFFKTYQLELVSSSKPIPSVKVCCRCGGEIYQKETTDFQTGKSCFIDKCKVCGYC
jgi:hypothetical protein